MYQFRRNQLIIMVLVFMIAIAGYLQLTTDPAEISAFVETDEPDPVVVVLHVWPIETFSGKVEHTFCPNMSHVVMKVF